jgi:GNAT superfamily N-acetyltransferase
MPPGLRPFAVVTLHPMNITLAQLSDDNVADYERLTHEDKGSPCYCSFWHQKWTSMEDYDREKAEHPERLKACVLERMRAKFHVGVIAYADGKPCAWVSVGPLIDFYWTWRRVAHVGDAAKQIAGIMCFRIAPEFRGQKLQSKILETLKTYGAAQGWRSIEAYPFSDEAIATHGSALAWPGRIAGYEGAGFTKDNDHWLSSDGAQRFIYRVEI